ncbi:MAG: 3-phosphoshikimate 1-carboxyvinyltransferase [Clostridia bacterium]|nr:3-phosphoshikimate 1-carboxyvinyltransferase [Clostridia bacterium]
MNADRVTFSPSAARGCVKAPPSKSDAHRRLICAGLAKGESVVRNVARSEDLCATVRCLEALGAKVVRKEDGYLVSGCDPAARGEALFDCGECGSTLRFFFPLALLSDAPAVFSGGGRLMERPMGEYERICRAQGIGCEKKKGVYRVQGRLSPGAFEVNGNISSQYISGLTFALPLLEGDSAVRIVPPFSSAPYVRMTLKTLGEYGVEAKLTNEPAVYVGGGQRYRATDTTVEGDWSNAAFLDAFNTLGGQVEVGGLQNDSLQGDRVYKAYFGKIVSSAPTLDLSDCPDLGPVCMALAAAHHGAVFTGCARLRLKESDRAAVMAEELEKFGVKTVVEEDRVTVYGGAKPPVGTLYGHGDHRIVMALSLLCSVTGGRIAGCRAVNKSFPDYFEKLKELGIEVEEDGMDQ